ncbi:hypothetical protein M433DRAFT_149378, partial [Acidomyces richmondensis BFW]
ISAAVKAYNVSKSALFRRIHRRFLREHFTPTNKNLNKTEEERYSRYNSKARGGQGVRIK